MGEEANATVMLSGPVELLCQSDAIPPPTLSWRKDGRPLFRKPGLTVSENGRLLKVYSLELFAMLNDYDLECMQYNNNNNRLQC